MAFIAKNPLIIPEVESPTLVPDPGTRGLFAGEDGWYEIDSEGQVQKIGADLTQEQLDNIDAVPDKADKADLEMISEFVEQNIPIYGALKISGDENGGYIKIENPKNPYQSSLELSSYNMNLNGNFLHLDFGTISATGLLDPKEDSDLANKKYVDNSVPNWAKQPDKPKYTASEVGAYGKSTVDNMLKETHDEIDNVDKKIEELKSTVNSMPEDYLAECERVIKKAQETEADLRLITFADPHSYDTNKYKKYNDLLQSGCIDALVGLGDYQIYSSKLSKNETIFNLTKALSQAGRTPNCFYVIGNHDAAIKDANSGIVNMDNLLTKKEAYDCFSRHLNGSVKFDEKNPMGGYYYVDYDAAKIRLIILNTSDIYEEDGSIAYKYTSSVVMKQTQITWLVDEALDFTDKFNPSEWSVLVCQHAYFDTSEKMISQILTAVKTGATLDKTWTFKRTLDNPNSTEYRNLYPLEYATPSQTKVDVTCTLDGDTFIFNGTSNNPVSFETIPSGTEYLDLKAGVSYTFGAEKVSGESTSGFAVYIKIRTADGTETAVENKNLTFGLMTFTPASDCKLIRFAISPAKDVTFTNLKVRPIFAVTSEVEGGIDESEILTNIAVNKDFSTQGGVNVIGVLYGHDHANKVDAVSEIPFIQFISDNAELDDFYVKTIDGITAGEYYVTSSNGVKFGFTLSQDIPNAVSIGYNQYFAQYGTSAQIRIYDSNGMIKMYTAKASNYKDGMTEITGFVQERTPNTVATESCNIVSIDKKTHTITITHYGTGVDRIVSYGYSSNIKKS